MSLTSPDAKAVVRALDDLTTQVRRFVDAQSTPVGEHVYGADDDATTPRRAVALCTPCARCSHPYNWHASRGGCEFGNETNRCGCDTFTAGERPEPVDPWRILGAEAPAADEGAPYLLRVLVDRAARGVLSLPGEGEALRRRAEQMINGRETWKAKAEEIERDRDDWRRRAEAMERAVESTAADALAHRGCHRDLMAQCRRAEQAEELLRVAHETSNRSETERASAVQRAEQAEAEQGRLRDLLRSEKERADAAIRREETAEQAAEEAQRERDQAISVLADVLRRFTPALVNGKYAFYQAEQPVPIELFDRWRAVVAHDVERPWWQQLDEAQAAIERVRAKVADWREWNEQETAWAVRDIEDAITNAPAPQPLDGTEQPTTESTSIREQKERPTHPDGTPYRYHEIKAEGWDHCDGCRTWTTATPERPHQCPETHTRGPVSGQPKEQ